MPHAGAVTTVTEFTIEFPHGVRRRTGPLPGTTDGMPVHTAPRTQHLMGARVMTFQTTKPISRRALLPLIAASALAPALLLPSVARAQGAMWQIYRREDLGFEIEMPGRPEIQKERIDGQTSVEASVEVDQMLFGIGYREYEEAVSVQEMAAAQRLAARSLGTTITRETMITMNGFPGIEVIIESNLLSMAMRIVLIPERKRSISAMVSGHGRLSENASVRRFLDSFKLLP